MLIKQSESKECIICHCCYFLDKGFKFQTCACNGCHDVLMVSTKLSDVVIITVISKSEDKEAMQNISFTKKKQNVIKHKNLFKYGYRNSNVMF